VPEIVVATNNRGKAAEFERLFAQSGLKPLTLTDLGVQLTIAEDGESYEENARLKAHEALRLTGRPSLGDDSGIEVDALGGAPGLKSARFAGDDANDAANRRLLLERLGDRQERTARFRCVLVAALAEGEELTAEGVCEGEIAREERGDLGFGYDPIFVPEGLDLTMAELPPAKKDEISHRGRAVREMLRLLDKR
jgi:XTP/dITP diphosphohydrolase